MKQSKNTCVFQKLSFVVVLMIISLIFVGCGSGNGNGGGQTGKNDIPEEFIGNYEMAEIYDTDGTTLYSVDLFVVSKNKISWNSNDGYVNVTSSKANNYSRIEYDCSFKYYYLYSDGNKIGIADYYICEDGEWDAEIYLGSEAKRLANNYISQYDANIDVSDIADNVVNLFANKE